MSASLFTKDTRAIMYGNRENAIQRMLDFDYVCGRKKPSIAAIVNETRAGLQKYFFGPNEILIPMYRTINEAMQKHPDVSVMLNFASFRSAYSTTKEALEHKKIKTIAVIAEGVPERRERELAALAKKLGKVIIGPATVGGMTAGAFKIGNTGGTIDNIIASRLFQQGSVGLVSKSGGMINELFNIVSHNSDGVYEGMAIGGDKYPGSTLLSHLLRYENNPKVKMMVCLGEVGGTEEYDIAEALKKKQLKKPLVMWVTGTCAKMFLTEVQFGHAGAKAGSNKETADAKNKALVEAGAIVPNSFNDFGEKIRKTYERVSGNKYKEIPIPENLPNVPMDYKKAVKEGKVRRPTNFICTISDDRGEEATYGDRPISEFVEKGTLGETIAQLWFKKKLPKYANDYIEMILKTTADHGPCVSGAHNAIVAARAGRDVMSSLASGILTIGPRFGGAISDAAMFFKQAKDAGTKPEDFVKEMKKQGKYIPGIGHRIKSIGNPDKRVTVLVKFAKKNFKSTEYLDYALAVEKITTQKKGTLILNVDGCIGVTFLDLMKSTGQFKDAEIDEMVNTGVLNSFFLLGRSIGIIGHILDQYRLKQGLYRHPQDDVAYMHDE
ncbi:MAG: citrate/2-methylcitrate synthase [archaeon]